jgi:hypothetical protein
MTNDKQPQISVISPISPALDRVKLLLFQPFDFGKWMIIGFCAWVATLGKGGAHVNIPMKYKDDFSSAAPQFEHFKESIINNLPLIIPIACIIAAAMIIMWVVLLWLSSRGQFMFLDCIAHNKAEVKKPWEKYRTQANSLFLFRLVLQLAGPIVLLLVIALPFALIWAVTRCIDFKAVPIAILITGAFIFGIFIIVLVLAIKFTIDFAVPIMYCTAQGSLAAWGRLWALITAKPGNFILYILFQIVIQMAISTLLIALACVTCCIAGCIMAIPYIGTVFILPVLVFTRSYSLYYISQYGPDFDVFGPAAPVQSTQ